MFGLIDLSHHNLYHHIKKPKQQLYALAQAKIGFVYLFGSGILCLFCFSISIVANESIVRNFYLLVRCVAKTESVTFFIQRDFHINIIIVVVDAKTVLFEHSDALLVNVQSLSKQKKGKRHTNISVDFLIFFVLSFRESF